MPKVLRPIGHEERLSIVDHLDELRSRLIVCGIALVIAFAACFWQNQVLLKVLNRALPATPATSSNHISGLTADQVKEQKAWSQIAGAADALAASQSQSATDRAHFAQLAQGAEAAAKALPKDTAKRLPITIGVGEPFTTTLTVSAYFALLITLPVLLYEAYAFVIPALRPEERRIAVPVMLAAPLLFLTGVAFAYFVVLPPAVHFLQGYNAQNFDILVQAKTYYTFQIFTMLGIGLAFQLPLGLLALQRLGAINAADADAELALRYGHHRGHRGRHARGRSGHHRPGDAPACRVVSGQYRHAQDRRSPRCCARRSRVERLVRRRTRPHLTSPDSCCLIFVAADAGVPCRLCTSGSPS